MNYKFTTNTIDLTPMVLHHYCDRIRELKKVDNRLHYYINLQQKYKKWRKELDYYGKYQKKLEDMSGCISLTNFLMKMKISMKNISPSMNMTD